MKTLVRPQTQNIIAIPNNSFAKNKIEFVHFTQKKIKFNLKIFIFPLSFLIFILVPDSPQELSSICNRYNSVQVCNTW